MSDSKADFKARREMLGLTQQDVADAVNVATRSVKRWERDGFRNPPDEVWAYIESCEETQSIAVNESVDLVVEKNARSVNLTYYYNQEQYDALGRDDSNFRMVNAISRRVAMKLIEMGYEVSFNYPDDPENLYHSVKNKYGDPPED